jgi:hypothetical protein
MRYAFAALAVSSVAFLAQEPTADASWSWWSSAIASVGASGPANIAAPTGQPSLGSNFAAIAPWYSSTGGLGWLMLDRTPCQGQGCSTTDYQAWLFVGDQWTNTGSYFWGLNATSNGFYGYAWTSASDTTPGAVWYRSITGTSAWASPSWNSTYTSAAMVSGSPGTPDNAFGWLTRKSGTSTSLSYVSMPSYSVGAWSAGDEGSGFNGEQVAIDAYAFSVGASTQYPISVSSSGVVQYYAIFEQLHPPDSYIKQYSYTTTAANPTTGSCTSGTGTFYAVQVAKKNGFVFAIGGTAGAFSGPGTVYYLASGSGTCWQTVGSAGSGPGSNAVSIATDNGEYAYNGTAGAYSVWVTDNSNNVYAACEASSCSTPPF